MLCISPFHDINRNLALEEHLLETWQGAEPLLLLYHSSPAVVVGAHQNTWAEANAQKLRENGIALARRISGGGTVYHDGGTLCFAYIVPCENPSRLELGSYLAPVVAGLNELGIPAQGTSRNDILLDGGKITGTAARLLKDRLLFHGTILYDADLDWLQGVLHQSPGLVWAKGAKSVKSRVTNVRRHWDMGPFGEFRDRVAQVLAPGQAQMELEDKQVQAAKELAAAKYADMEGWVLGRNPACELEMLWQSPKGGVQPVRLQLKHNRVESADAAEAEELLRGCAFAGEAMREALAARGWSMEFPTPE